ncbi:MAG: acyltransferase [Bacteroidetes bacterium]|nr:acyltransferase [Bacteroidota bacterium]
MPHKTQYLSNLTPLRGIAALLVAIFHFEMAIARFVPAQQTMFFEKSYLMVDLFFIMSGFIIFHVYRESFLDAIKKENLKKFIVARFARIYPLHIFSLLLLVILVIVFSPAGTYPNRIEDPAAILTNVFLLQSYYIHNIFTWNIPAWSISAEWISYMLFPLLVLFISKKKRLSVVVLIVLVITAYLSIMFLLPRKNPMNPAIPVPHNINTTYDYGFLRGIAGFITGMIMYILYQSSTAKKIFQKDVTVLFSLILLVLAMHFAVSDGYCIILFAAIVIAFACNGGYLHKICNNRILQYLGLISYSIYLMQIFLQEPFSKGLRLSGVIGLGRGKQNIAFFPGLMYCIIYLLLLVAISSLTYYCIEQPCRKFINRKWGG